MSDIFEMNTYFGGSHNTANAISNGIKVQTKIITRACFHVVNNIIKVITNGSKIANTNMLDNVFQFIKSIISPARRKGKH